MAYQDVGIDEELIAHGVISRRAASNADRNPFVDEQLHAYVPDRTLSARRTICSSRVARRALMEAPSSAARTRASRNRSVSIFRVIFVFMRNAYCVQH